MARPCRHQGKQVEDIGTSYHNGGMATRRVLKPGDAFEDTISLSKGFPFAAPGMHEVHGSYYLAFKDPETDSGETIWEDYASADFMVTVEPKELETPSGYTDRSPKRDSNPPARPDGDKPSN